MNSEHLLSGTIAVELGFVRPEQLRECIREQDRSLDPRPLGTLFLEKGYMTPEQLETMLDRQRRRLLDSVGGRLFGQVALENQIIDSGRLGECIREQLRTSTAESRPLLGQVMLRKGYLTTDQVRTILQAQGKALFRCPGCGFACSHPTTIRPEEAVCPKCRNLLTLVQEAKDYEVKAIPDTTSEFKAPLARMGKFEVLGEIARGAMAIVFKAYDRSLERTVALKVLKEGDADAAFIRRLHREAALAAKLQHPNIVTVYEVGETEGVHYLCMDYIPGWDLLDYIRIRRLPREAALQLLVKIARAVEFAHESGVIHRDLKPSNILIKKDGTPYIMDFGLAKALDTASALTKDGTTLGTPYYMSPEQVLGQIDQVDSLSDIYALGVILYEILTGTPPHVGVCTMEVYQRILSEEPRRPSEIQTDLDPDLEAICLKAIEKERALRYATAGDFADDLQRFLSAEPVRAARPTPLRIFWKRVRKHRRKIALAAAALAVATGAWIGASEILRANAETKAREIARKSEETRAAARASALASYDEGCKKVEEATRLAFQKDWKFLDIQTLYREAAENFEAALSEDPSLAKAALELGRCQEKLDASSEAFEAYGQAIDAAPNVSTGYLYRGLARLRRLLLDAFGGPILFDTAKKDKIDVSQMYRETPDAERLCRAALKDLEKALQLPLRDDEKHLIDGAIHLIRRETDKALTSFEQSIEAGTINPTGHWGAGIAHYFQGWLQFRKDSFKKASRSFDSALRQDPTDRLSYLLHSSCLLQLGEAEQAIAQLKEFVNHFSSEANAHSIYGTFLAMNGDLEGALHEHTLACQLGDSPMRHYNRAMALYELGRISESLEALKPALEAKDPGWQVYRLAGYCHIHPNNPDPNTDIAADYFERSLSHRTDVEMLFKLAEFRIRQEDLSAARACLDRAIRANPRHAAALELRGRIAAKEEMLDQAEADFRKAIEVDENLGQAYLSLGQLLIQRERYGEAAQVLQEGIDVDESIRPRAEALMRRIPSRVNPEREE